MKRFLKYLLTFIVPNKMEYHRDMNLFISVLIFLLCAISCPGIGSLRLNKTLKENYLDECYAYEDTYELQLVNFNVADLPTFTINEETHTAENVVFKSSQNVYELKYISNNGGLDVNLTIVYEFDKTTSQELDFDLDGYLKKIPFNENKELVSRDILVVYTKDIMYYIFNRGYVLNYMTVENAVLEDYHYINVPQWEQTGNWSMYKVQRDENGNIKPDGTGQLVYLPSADNKEYNENINQLFTYNGSQNVGIYSYLELSTLGLPFATLENPLANYTDIMVQICASSVGLYSYILSFFYIVVLPLLWILVVWLLMRKNAEITRFREYYSICAVSFIVPSLIAGIIGLWIPYTIISKIVMIVQAVYFFIVVSIVNAAGNKKNNNNNNNENNSKSFNKEQVEFTEVKTTPLHDVIENPLERRKASIIE